MVEVREFRDEDLDLFSPSMTELVAVNDWRGMLRGAALFGPAWTMLLNGRVIGCAGLAMAWPGRAQAWCVLAPDIPKMAWLGIHRVVAARLAQTPALGLRRIEADALYGFPPAARWLEMLGFEREGLARAYGPGGEDFLRFARVR